MVKKCRYMKRTSDCLGNYTRSCATDAQREATSLLFSGISRVHKLYCSPGSRLRDEYAKHILCLRKTMDDRNRCSGDLKVALESMTNETTWDQRPGLTCCAYNRLSSCVRDAIRNHCGSRTVAFLKKMMRTAVSRLPEIICSGYSSRNDVCRQLPPPGTELSGERPPSPLFRLLPRLLPHPDDGF